MIEVSVELCFPVSMCISILCTGIDRCDPAQDKAVTGEKMR